ncbi:hypothetical protein [Streptomyces sp. NBC_00271]|uniref:hypothetical protein n=1 Tax=Streptomyces sp. NBC_00271 TaxID=2975697 RepID=UPI002E2DD994|nr:hypothetical protein [Streptomyces sp. NBC_00271]
MIGGLIHYAAVPEHLSEGWPYGLFFTALGAFGFVWAVRIWFGPNVPLVTAGLSFNIGCIALWAVSRTTGLSFGPQAASGESLNLREFLCPRRTIVRRGHRNSRFLRNICHN